jgi:glycosyltransferase involved in cell wall biosynthesis
MGTRLSVLMPAYNERENLVELLPRTTEVLDQLGCTYEIVVVDDGSTDGTRREVAGRRNVRYVRLRRNSGKSAALSVGLHRVEGEIVVLMDADGQDDPTEIPHMLEQLDAGYDLVTGRRGDRQDRASKRMVSRLYNVTTAKVTGVEGHDFNSGLKMMTQDVASSLELYGELHRYIPVLASWAGFRVCEVEVRHLPRLHGESKFGRARLWRGFLDLVTVKFLTTYTARPFHLFGGIGMVVGLLGGVLLTWMGVSWLLGHAIGNRPALLAGVLLVLVAIQMVSLGLISELIVHLRRRTKLDASVEGEE